MRLPKRRKYRNKPVYQTPDGSIVGAEHTGPKKKIADSLREYRRLLELQAEERAGRIRQLRTQVRFVLRVNGLKIGAYWADSTYIRGGRLVVEDVKSDMTRRLAVYKLKKLLVRALYGIEITEV